VDRLQVAQMRDTGALAPGREFHRGRGVGFPGVRVPDIGREEFPEALGSLRLGQE